MIHIFKNIRNCLFVLAVLFLAACQSEKNHPDVSGIQAEIHFIRFDKELFAVREKLPEIASGLKSRYPVFFDLYTSGVLHLGETNDPNIPLALKGFTMDKDMKKVFEDVKTEFNDLSKEEKHLTESFKLFKYYFPKKEIPTVYSFQGGFNYSVVTGEKILGVGLEMYLGESYPAYRAMQLPHYKTRRMKKEYLCNDMLKGFLQAEFGGTEGNTFLSQCIDEGKMLYLLECLQPDAPDTIRTGYSKEQIKWLEKNEAHLWAFFIEKDLLFSTKPNEYLRFLSEGPGTNGLPKEAPSRIGAWVGYRIVKKYMEKDKSLSPDRLMNEKNNQNILNRSGYKPSK